MEAHVRTVPLKVMDTRQAERSEMEGLASVTIQAPAVIARELGLHFVTDEGVVMTLATQADVLALNRIVGLGVETPATQDQLARLVKIARERGTKRLFVQLAPGHEPAAIPAWVEAEGGKQYNRWVRLWRRVDDFPEVRTDLRVDKLSAREAERSGEIVAESFDMPMSLAPWFASVVGRPGWTHFGAFDGEQLVGSAAIYTNRTVGWLGFAATLAAYRGRGVQGALIRRRVGLGRELGCEWVITETAEQTREHSAPSYRNMIRYGFTEGYFRQNYLLSLARA
jgi:GNAT superfamily N-acetyltransferase